MPCLGKSLLHLYNEGLKLSPLHSVAYEKSGYLPCSCSMYLSISKFISHAYIFSGKLLPCVLNQFYWIWSPCCALCRWICEIISLTCVVSELVKLLPLHFQSITVLCVKKEYEYLKSVLLPMNQVSFSLVTEGVN